MGKKNVAKVKYCLSLSIVATLISCFIPCMSAADVPTWEFVSSMNAARQMHGAALGEDGLIYALSGTAVAGSYIESVEVSPPDGSSAVVGLTNRVEVTICAEIAAAGVLQAYIYGSGADDKDWVYIPTCQSTVRTLGLDVDSSQEGCRDYTISIQFRHGATSGPIDTTEPCDAVYSVENYTICWESPTANFCGTVTDFYTGARISGASVQWGSYSDTTDSNGEYYFSSVPCEIHNLDVSKTGYNSYSESFTPTCMASSIRDVTLVPLADDVILNVQQFYNMGMRVLSLNARAIDTLHGEVTAGLFTWSLRDTDRIELERGPLTYNSSEGEWRAKQTISGGLMPGNYTVHYQIITDRERNGYAVGHLFYEGQYDLVGKVRDGLTLEPLEDVQVAVAGLTTQTTAQGEYSFTGVDAESASDITGTKTGYATYLAPLNPPSQNKQIVRDFEMYPSDGTKPVITGLRGKYEGISLEGLTVHNEYMATVDWNGTPGVVEFYANDTLKAVVPGTTHGATAQFNMGTDFPGALSPSANKVRVIAKNNEGVSTDPFEKPVVVIPLPPAIIKFTPWFSIQKTDNDDIHIALDFSFPKSAIKHVFDLPVIGKFGAEFAANASFDYTISDGDWEAAFGIGAAGGRVKRLQRPTKPGVTRSPKMKLYIGKKEITGKIKGGASGTAKVISGITFNEVFVEGSLVLKLELARVGLLDLLGPGLSSVVGRIPGLGNLVKAISIIIYVEPELGGQIVFALEPEFEFDRMEIKGDVGVEAAYEPSLGKIKMRLYIGGRPGVTFQVPGDLIKELRFRAYAGAEFRWWIITLGPYEYVFVSVTIPAKSGLAEKNYIFVLKPSASNNPVPKPMNREYLKDGPARLVVYEPSAQVEIGGLYPLEAFRMMGGTKEEREEFLRAAKSPVSRQADLPLIENVFPYSEPSLAPYGTELMLVYVSDNGAPGDLQFTDINWMWFDGMDWTTPAPIAVDTQAEFAPSIAFDRDGDAVAVWERVKDPNFDTADIRAMAAEMEIVWSRWDRALNIWSEPEELTHNDHLDHTPLVCGPMGDGSVLAVWTENQVNLLIGEGPQGATSNSLVLYSKWDPESHSWSAAQTLVGDLPYRMSQSMAGKGNKAIYAWTRDMDGDTSTTADQEIYYSLWDSVEWSPTGRLTNDSAADRTIRAALGDSGDVYLVWQRNEDLVLNYNLSTTTSIARADSQTVAFADYAMTLGPAGNLVLLWQEQSQEGVDGYYAVYDPASGRWSRDARLFADAFLERSFAPVWDNVGNLTVAYNRVDIQPTTKTLTVEGGEVVEIPGVPTPGRVDLGVLKRPLAKDLGMVAGDFSAQGGNFLPGDPVILSARVRNLGDLSVENVVVAFYDGDPSSGGVEIVRQTIHGWLDGATSSTVEANWIVVEPAAAHTLFAVVDPDGLVSESDENNNTLSIRIGGTDLIASLHSATTEADGSGRIVTDVWNAGAPGAPETTLAIRREGESGTPLATATIPVLELGRLAQVVLDLPSGTVPMGETLFTIRADDTGLADDVDLGNNTVTFAISGPTPTPSPTPTPTPTPSPTPWRIIFDFIPNPEDWTTGTVTVAFTVPAFTWEADYLIMASSTNTNTFGYWMSPQDAIPASAEYLYRARFNVSTDITDQAVVPWIRLRANSLNLQQYDVLSIESAGDGGASPDVAGTDYDLYFVPPANDTAAMLAFDLLNFSPNDAATAEVSLDTVTVDRFALVSLPTPTVVQDYTYELSQDGWTTGGAPIAFSSPQYIYSSGALELRAITNTNTFGFWGNHPADITIEADKLYRGTFEVRTDVTNPALVPEMRLRFNTGNFQASHTFGIASIGDGANSPGTTNTTYDRLYFVPPANCVGEELLVSFDILNFNSGDAPTASLILDRAIIETLEPPNLP